MAEINEVNPIDPNCIALTDLYFYRAHNNLIFPIVLRAKITKEVVEACKNRLSLPSNNSFDRDMHKSHILTDSLGGPNNYWNLFSQLARSNLDAFAFNWRIFEVKLGSWINNFKDGDFIDWRAWVGHCYQPIERVLVGNMRVAAIWKSKNLQVKDAMEKIFMFTDYSEEEIKMYDN